MRFNKRKYDDLLSRLEAKEVSLLSVKNNNSTFRFDSEFFLKIFDRVFEKLLSHKTQTVGALSSWVTQGPNPAFTDEGYYCLTGRNINSGRVNYEDSDFVSETEFKNLKKYRIEYGDILITLKGKGSIGKIGFVHEKRDAIFSRDIGIIRSKNIDPSYLHIYLISEYGKLLVDRGETGGTGQSTLTTTYLKENVFVPRLKIESEISSIHKKSENLYSQANKIYSETADSLIAELNFQDWLPTEKNTVVKRFSLFETNGRLDAEYYQPRYDEITSKLKNYIHGSKPFRSCVNIDDDNFEPPETIEYEYIELADIGGTGEIVNSTKDIGKNLPGRARRLIKTGDVIVSSIEGSLDKCAYVSSKFDKALCSTGFYVINSKEILPEVLLLLFKSFPIQQLMKQRCSGTILTAISRDELNTIPIPILPMGRQNELVKQIKNSFKLREESRTLIDKAKKAVEIAIEQNEQAAKKFINNNI